MGSSAKVLSDVSLVVSRRSGDALIPLRPLDSMGPRGLDIEDGVVFWEDEPATLSVALRTSMPIIFSTVRINDGTALETVKHETQTLTGTRTLAYDYVFDLGFDDLERQALEATGGEVPFSYRFPFAYTCGFARVRVMFRFVDRTELEFGTRDLVCLDEYHTDEREGIEHVEEENVRRMYLALVEARDNQASEWMFTPRPLDVSEVLSSDDFTDWSHASLDALVRAASAALDLVYDLLEDESDAFPNERDPKGARSRFDTFENRSVLALLRSVANKVSEVEREVATHVEELGATIRRLRSLMDEASRRRGREESLPVLALIEESHGTETEWLSAVRDLHERTDEALGELCDYLGGDDLITEVDFVLPPRQGLFATDAAYMRLRDAMVRWSIVEVDDVTTRDAFLYSLRASRVFEYYALHRMLSWLHAHGSRENLGFARPIDWFVYSAHDLVSDYAVEDRCANTYHLARGKDGATEEIDLYFTPAFYEDDREENGIPIHRLTPGGNVWTPDFLIVVYEGDRERRFVVDAKYQTWSRVVASHGELARCLDKYLLASGCDGDLPGSGIDGVWCLCGRAIVEETCELPGLLEEAAGGSAIDTTAKTCGAAPWSSFVDERQVSDFFSRLGVRSG